MFKLRNITRYPVVLRCAADQTDRDGLDCAIQSPSQIDIAHCLTNNSLRKSSFNSVKTNLVLFLGAKKITRFITTHRDFGSVSPTGRSVIHVD